MAATSKRTGPLLTAPLVVAILLLVVGPLLVFLLYSVLTPVPFSVEFTLTLESYRRVASEELWWRLIASSLQVGAVTATVSVFLGYLLAYYMAFEAGRAKFVMLGLTAVSILGGYLVRVYAWRTILGTEGLVNTMLLRLGVVDEPQRWLIFNRGAVIVALANIFIPFAAIVIYARLANLQKEHVQAARDLGANRRSAFRRVTLPLSGRAVFLAFAFVFLLSAADYVTPQLLGGTRGTMVGVAVQDQFQRVGNWPLGAALGFTIFAVSAVCIGAVWALMRLLGLLPKGAQHA
jgi:spermidine/putrescine transport system permease protein